MDPVNPCQLMTLPTAVSRMQVFARHRYTVEMTVEMRVVMEFHRIGWADDVDRVSGPSGVCSFRARQCPIVLLRNIRYVFDKNED